MDSDNDRGFIDEELTTTLIGLYISVKLQLHCAALLVLVTVRGGSINDRCNCSQGFPRFYAILKFYFHPEYQEIELLYYPSW